MRLKAACPKCGLSGCLMDSNGTIWCRRKDPRPAVKPRAQSRQTRRLDRLCEAQGHRCAYCREEFAPYGEGDFFRRASIDHVVPRSSKGSRTSWLNQVAACHGCNCVKGSMEAYAFYELLCEGEIRPLRTPKPHGRNRYGYPEGYGPAVPIRPRYLEAIGYRRVELPIEPGYDVVMIWRTRNIKLVEPRPGNPHLLATFWERSEEVQFFVPQRELISLSRRWNVPLHLEMPA